MVALPAAGHSVGHAAACARVGALHDDKGSLLQRGHRQVPAVHHGLQGGAVARPHGVLHVQDAVVPAPHLQRVTGLSLGPSALLRPSCRYGFCGVGGHARTKNPTTTPRITWDRPEQGLGQESLENRRVRAKGWARPEGKTSLQPPPPPTFPSQLDSHHLSPFTTHPPQFSRNTPQLESTFLAMFITQTS